MKPQHLPNSPLRHLFCVAAFVAMLIVPGNAFGTLITSSGDAALVGASTQTFDAEATDTYFSTQTFLIGANGFSVTTISLDMHLDDQYCASFGTSGNCLDTIANGNGPNDDFDVVFTGAGVTAFGFDLTALDIDWTVETFDAADNLLGTYIIASQSPGQTGFDRRGYFGATETVAIQYFTVRSAGSDRALIDNLSYTSVPEPNAGMLIGLGLLALAGSRFREQSAVVVPVSKQRPQR